MNKKVICKNCNSIYENDKVPMDDAHQYYCPLCDNIRCFKEYQPQPTSKEVEGIIKTIEDMDAEYWLKEFRDYFMKIRRGTDDFRDLPIEYRLWLDHLQKRVELDKVIKQALTVSDERVKYTLAKIREINNYGPEECEMLRLNHLDKRMTINIELDILLNNLPQPNLDTLKQIKEVTKRKFSTSRKLEDIKKLLEAQDEH